MEVDPIDRLIELGLAPELTYVVKPAGVGPRLNVGLVITVIGLRPAIIDDEREDLREFRPRTVDHTMVVEAGQSTSFEDRNDLNPFSMSFESVSVHPPIEEVHEVTEVPDSSIMAYPAMDSKVSIIDDDRLLKCQGNRERIHELAEVNERQESFPVFGSLNPIH